MLNQTLISSPVILRITKEVSADSKEAKAEQKKQEEKEKAAAKPTAGPSLSALGIGGTGYVALVSA